MANTKGNKIEGIATVVEISYIARSASCPIQTPKVFMTMNGKEYSWAPEETKMRKLYRGCAVNLSGFVREDGATLYRVSWTPAR